MAGLCTAIDTHLLDGGLRWLAGGIYQLGFYWDLLEQQGVVRYVGRIRREPRPRSTPTSGSSSSSDCPGESGCFARHVPLGSVVLARSSPLTNYVPMAPDATVGRSAEFETSLLD